MVITTDLQYRSVECSMTDYRYSVQVNIPSTSGDMGVLANHVPSIEQLKPGLLEIFTEGGNKEEYFVAGGFAIVQPGSKLSVNVTEAYKIEEFSREAVTSNLQEAQRLASGGGSEEDVAEAKIQVEVSRGKPIQINARQRLTR